MKTLTADIKNKTFKNAYLICGEEEYLKLNYKNQLIKAVTDDNTMNLALYEGKNIDINDAIFVGDSREDMQAAKDLGIRGVLVGRKNDKDVNIEADYYIRDLNDLRGILF